MMTFLCVREKEQEGAVQLQNTEMVVDSATIMMGHHKKNLHTEKAG